MRRSAVSISCFGVFCVFFAKPLVSMIRFSPSKNPSSLKALPPNSVRTSHNSVPTSFLKYCFGGLGSVRTKSSTQATFWACLPLRESRKSSTGQEPDCCRYSSIIRISIKVSIIANFVNSPKRSQNELDTNTGTTQTSVLAPFLHFLQIIRINQ